MNKKLTSVVLAATLIISSIGVIAGSSSKVKAAEIQVGDTQEVSVNYSTHVQNIGWQEPVRNGEMSGTSAQSLRLEGIKINVAGMAGGVRYVTHVESDGWQDWVSNGAIAGTSGRGLRLESIKIELTGEIAQHYDIYYRTHVQDYGWQGWVKNGELSGTSGLSKRLEGIKIILVAKGSTPTVSGTELTYATHVQNIGWMPPSTAGYMSGTAGKSYRLEAIKMNIASSEYPDAGISYSTHIQNVGWQAAVSNGSLSGTSGQGLRLESIKINLTGSITNTYSIRYKVHVQNKGWSVWKYNGQEAGTTGKGRRLEGIIVELIPNSEVPANAGYEPPEISTPQPGLITIKNVLLTCKSGLGVIPYSSGRININSIGPAGVKADCSGFASWVVFNVINRPINFQSDNAGSVLGSYNIGVVGATNGYMPGDIMYKHGHVCIIIGTCSDGSVVIAHSDKSGGGVQLAGTYGESNALAAKYMAKTGCQYKVSSSVGNSYLSGYSQFRWYYRNGEVDPDGYYGMSAAQILADMYGE